MTPTPLAAAIRTAPDARERAYRVFRRAAARSRTVNQLNRIHIALGNYMTPAELRYFDAALAVDDAFESPSREFVGRHARQLPVGRDRPVEFERRGPLRGLTLYTAGGSPESKTLIIGFAGNHNRMMVPTPWLLDCLNPALFDLLMLRDLGRAGYLRGIPGVGDDFFALLDHVGDFVDLPRYRRSIAVGTSAGGLPALLAAVRLRLDRGVAIGAQDVANLQGRLQTMGLDEAPFLATLAARPAPFPDLRIAYAGDHPIDVDAARALHELVPSRLLKVPNCNEHGLLGWLARRGMLPAFLAKALGQGLEHADLGAWRVDPGASVTRRGDLRVDGP